MNMKPRTISTLLHLTAVLLIISLLATASFGDTVRRVVFPKGKNTVTYRAKLQRQYADYDAYVLRTRRGQTLSVRLISSDPNAHLSIYETKVLGPTEDSMIAEDVSYPREWSGKMPITSEYSIQVYGVRTIDDPAGTGAAYSIEITLK